MKPKIVELRAGLFCALVEMAVPKERSELENQLNREISATEHGELKKMKSLKRAAQFVAGRLAAKAAVRKALKQPDLTLSIGRGLSGEPIWPPDILGSIAHTQSGGSAIGVAVALRSTHPEILNIGVDLECHGRQIDLALAHKILTIKERETFAAAPDPGATLLRFFIAKEAIYKAVWPSVRARIGFGDVEFTFTPDLTQGTASFASHVAGLIPAETRLKVEFVLEGGVIIGVGMVEKL